MPEMKTLTVNGVKYDLRDTTKAPAGYGLGGACQEIDSLDNAKVTGFYLSGGGCPDGSWWTCIAQKMNDTYIIQDAYKRDGAKGHHAQRVFDGSAWGAWEWVNPPMAVGVEYRTTERIDGKVVFKKNVNGVIQYRLDGETTYHKYSDVVGAAPAGYGLGEETGQTVTDCNNALDNGWYVFNSGAVNTPWNGAGWLFTESYNSKYKEQRAGNDSYDGMTARRIMKNGTWVEWEWGNPPMSLGVEYRTTERIAGKAVYKKNVNGVIQYRLDGETTYHNYSDAVGAAPAGYGLGGAVYTSDLNKAIKPGWYYTNSSTANTSLYYTLVHVVAGGDNGQWIEQTQFDVNGTNFNRLHRVSKDSGATWIEEFENPPMALGKEYRTTERWNGKAVYVQRFEMAALPASGSGYVSIGIYPTAIISIEGFTIDTVNNARYAFPVCNSDNVVLARLGRVNTGHNLWVHVYADMSAHKGYFTVKYIKD